MMVTTQGSVLRLLAWQWRHAMLFAAAGLLAQALHFAPGWHHLVLPTMPLAVVGAAVGIFTSFRTNSCYARWWEGRQLWGRLVNLSRHFASQALTSFSPDVAREVIARHIAYVHLLRCALRDQDPWGDSDVVRWLDETTRGRLRAERNPCYALLHEQREVLTRACHAAGLDEWRYLAFDTTLAALLDAQGGCERIKKTPFPRGYTFISERLIIAFGLLLPFALIRDLGWVTVPLNLLVCGAFTLMSEAGRVLEDPFTMFWNGLPLSAMSTTIEINLRQRLGDEDVPENPKPDKMGVLM